MSYMKYASLGKSTEELTEELTEEKLTEEKKYMYRTFETLPPEHENESTKKNEKVIQDKLDDELDVELRNELLKLAFESHRDLCSVLKHFLKIP